MAARGRTTCLKGRKQGHNRSLMWDLEGEANKLRRSWDPSLGPAVPAARAGRPGQASRVNQHAALRPVPTAHQSLDTTVGEAGCIIHDMYHDVYTHTTGR